MLCRPSGYSFTYGISGGHSGMDTAYVTVTVTAVNDPPIATNDPRATDEDTAVTIDVLANDFDVDGDALVVTSVTEPSNGAVNINLDDTGTYTYTPTAGFNGTDAFDYVIADGDVATATATVLLTATSINENPEAVDDSVATPEGTSIGTNVLTNDSDIDDDVLSITAVIPPTFGEAVINPDNSVTYTPTLNFYGLDSFAYTVDDGNGGTDTAIVSITVEPVNDIPEAVDDTAATDESTAVSVDVLANDSDIDDDALTVTHVSVPTHGAAVINVGYAITYTPDPYFVGTDTFTCTLSDGVGGLDTATVTIDVLPVSSAYSLYPIALSADLLAGAEAGDFLSDILNGTQSGNFGWLTWTGSNSVPTLVAGFTDPGNSHTYNNPFIPGDHVVSVGDWVEGKPGVSKTSSVRNAARGFQSQEQAARARVRRALKER